MIDLLKSPWPWYVCGPLIGLMVPLLLIVANRQFGISTSFRHFCAACIPTKNEFFRYDWKKESWMLFLVAGVVIGGFIGNHLLKNEVPIVLSESAQLMFKEWKQIDSANGLAPESLFGTANFLSVTTLIFIVLGGFFIGFGTRWANGCTAGHAIMGLSLRNPGSLVAVIGFFIGGLFVSHVIIPWLL